MEKQVDGECCETAKTGGVLVCIQVVLYTVQFFMLLVIQALCIV
jgi:hypothetical protein